MKRAFLLVLAVLILAGAAFACYTPFRLWTLYVTGRASWCTRERALESAGEEKRQISVKDQILSASRLVTKDPAGYHLWRTPHGDYWIPEGSDYTLPFNLAEQAREIYGTGPQGVRAGDVVLDCGANVGVFTRRALDAGARLVVAIEPAPENIECLRRNFTPETAAGRVIVYPKGVWDKDDWLTLNVDPHNSAADSVVIHPREAKEGSKVPLTTIDKLVAELKLDRVDYVKMDIEGAEPNALRGGSETIKRWKPRVSISAYHAPDHPRVIPEILRGLRPDYQLECGPCAEIKFGIRPDILYFR